MWLCVLFVYHSMAWYDLMSTAFDGREEELALMVIGQYSRCLGCSLDNCRIW